jgi:hypothetical protein
VEEAFPNEGISETVLFIVHIERGFGIPAGDFLRRLLQFYRIEWCIWHPTQSQSS